MSFRNYFIKSNPSDYCYAISAYYAMVSASNKLPKLDGFRYVINEFAGEDIKDICEVFHHHKGKSDPLTIIKAAGDIQLFNLSIIDFDGDVVYYAYTSDIIVENKNHVYEVAAGFYFCNSHWVSVIQEEGEYWLFNDSAKPTKLNVDSLPQFVRPEGYEKDFMCVGTLFVKQY